MRLYVECGGSTRTVAVSIDDADASVGDLASALGFDADLTVFIDGVARPHADGVRDAGLLDGSYVTAFSHDETQRDPEADIWLGVVGGPDSGALHRVNELTEVSVGRDGHNDLQIDNGSVSGTHAVIRSGPNATIEVDDLESHNGTWIGSKSVHVPTPIEASTSVRMGSSSIAVRYVDRSDQPLAMSPAHADDAGHLLFNRPPRPPTYGAAQPLRLPELVEERSNPTLMIASLLVPIVFASVMVAVLGSWRYALFGLMSPAMAVANWIGGRRRVRRARIEDATTHRDALQLLSSNLDAAEAVERLRRSTFGPDMIEIRRRIEFPSIRLWERRNGSTDAMTVRVGTGNDTWKIPLAEDSLEGLAADVVALIEARQSLHDVEVLVDLRRGPVGLVGDRTLSTASVRSMVLQLATHHGPADLRIAVLTTPERLPEWQWAHWLPHAAAPGGGALVLTGDASLSLASSVQADLEHRQGVQGCGWLFIIDDADVLHGRSSSARRILESTAKGVFGVVVVDAIDQLPAPVATIIDVESDDGAFQLREPARSDVATSGLVDSVSIAVANELARSLARFEDPEVDRLGIGLPQHVGFDDLFAGLPDVDGVRGSWSQNRGAAVLRVSIGLSESGPFSLDLVHDGPHCLVAGTTGAGKSELLRTLVAGLAANHDPDHLVFVLIDYKGGSAFDSCSRLPHVVGTVTDLDDHLATRALLSLEAELRHREGVLRAAGAKDIIDYCDGGASQGALPRLVVVIDELATLRNELPDFVSSLIGIAQRGRSLGVHLVLATQRPSGAVDANIRANTNLRVALRVQNAGDSTDVIESTLAAEIDRSIPGRAFVRRGEGDLTAVQTAYVSGPASRTGPAVRIAAVELGSGAGPRFEETSEGSGHSILASFVETIIEASEPFDTPRTPWLEALPEWIHEGQVPSIRDLPSDGSSVMMAIADDPKNQRRIATGWSPNDGHLSITGVLGSGVTTAIRSAITELGRVDLGNDVWVFACDHVAGGLEGIDDFPHVSCRLEANETARHARLLSFLEMELDRRHELSVTESADLPLIVVAIDGIAGFCEVMNIVPGTERAYAFERLGRDGPTVGIVMLIGSTGVTDIPRSLRSRIRQHILLEQGDIQNFASFGIRAKDLPNFTPGRAFVGSKLLLGQVVDWEANLDDTSFRVGSTPPEVEGLSTSIDRTALPVASLDDDLCVPVGISERTRLPAALLARRGEHITIAGPPGSGRTTALRLIAMQVRAAASDVVLVGIAEVDEADLFETDVFDAGGVLDDLEHVLRMIPDDDRRWVIFIDDADRIDVDSGPLVELAQNAASQVTLVAAVRSSTARGSYGHWTRHVRSSGVGVILQPDNAVDGELFAIRLPRGERLSQAPGRGYLVMASDAEVVQLAH